MNTLTEKQNLRYDLLKANNYDVQNSKACYDFIAGNETATPEPQQAKTANGLADGVYLMHERKDPELFTGQQIDVLDRGGYTGVGVKLGGKSLVVSLVDMPGDEITLTKQQGGTRFITDYHNAVADWNGKENTDDIRGILNDDIYLEIPGLYIPSLGELYFILLHIRDINAALEAIGGKPLYGWYWASTQYSASRAWTLRLNGGTAGNTTKATHQGRVRAVSAFLPLNS